ncbi:alpha-ketoglutarate-dependent dioxygenase AlkB, partial [Zwartia sp.]|uniref:alpha-ketoglutarate-dependent dioxygenase AlkB n=1 Tax=Zwartia sp. TaxID=2978004 RepID=UPI002722C19B
MSMQTRLFDSTQATSPLTVLTKDGNVDYFPGVFDQDTCSELFTVLKDSLDWQTDQIFMFGKMITTKRKVAWVGDDGCSYTYSGVKKQPQPWTHELRLIKSRLEDIAHWPFNSCLLNLYHDGSEGMG